VIIHWRRCSVALRLTARPVSPVYCAEPQRGVRGGADAQGSPALPGVGHAPPGGRGPLQPQQVRAEVRRPPPRLAAAAAVEGSGGVGSSPVISKGDGSHHVPLLACQGGAGGVRGSGAGVLVQHRAALAAPRTRGQVRPSRLRQGGQPGRGLALDSRDMPWEVVPIFRTEADSCVLRLGVLQQPVLMEKVPETFSLYLAGTWDRTVER
jgi:hypothetical protein